MKRKTLWKPDLFWKWLTSEMLNLNLILFGKNPKPSLVINYYWFHFSGGENKIWIALAWGKRKYVLITISDSVILLLIIFNAIERYWGVDQGNRVRRQHKWKCTGNKQCKLRKNIKWIVLENCKINNMRLKCLLRSTYSWIWPTLFSFAIMQGTLEV